MNVRRAAILALVLAGIAMVLERGRAHRMKPAVPDPEAAAFDAGELPPSVLTGTPKDGGTLVVRVNVEPATLNPAVSPDTWTRRVVLHQVLETLVAQDPKDPPRYRIVPSLAVSWDESPDHLTCTFHLRPGVKWHDGATFDAADVVFTFDLLRNPAFDSEHLRPYLADVSAVFAPDPATVVVTYRKPYVWALRRMAEIPILPRHLLEGTPPAGIAKAEFSRAPVGTGPFRFVSWEPKQAVTLERFDGYWGPKAHLDCLVFRMIPDVNAAWQLLLRGDVDIDESLSSDQYASAADEPGIRALFHRVKYFDSSFGFIPWNTARPLFQDSRVRRALSMLVDRESLRTTLYRGQPRLCQCVNYQDGAGCDAADAAPAYDPAGARKLLVEAGWADHDGDGILDRDGVPFRFTAMLSAGATVNEQLLLAYRQELYRAGIQMELQKLEWAVFVQKLRNHDFDAGLLAFTLDPDNDPYQAWHSSQAAGGSNYMQYRSEAADALIAEIRGTFDEGDRAAVQRRFNHLVLEDQPVTLLFNLPRRVLVKKSVRGAYVAPLPGFQYQDIWLDR